MKRVSIPLFCLASLFLAACSSSPPGDQTIRPARGKGNPFDEFTDPRQPVSRDQFLRALGE